jgi:hypothetical protein
VPVDTQLGRGCVAAPVEVALWQVAVAGEAAAALVCRGEGVGWPARGGGGRSSRGRGGGRIRAGHKL